MKYIIVALLLALVYFAALFHEELTKKWAIFAPQIVEKQTDCLSLNFTPTHIEVGLISEKDPWYLDIRFETQEFRFHRKSVVKNRDCPMVTEFTAKEMAGVVADLRRLRYQKLLTKASFGECEKFYVKYWKGPSRGQPDFYAEELDICSHGEQFHFCGGSEKKLFKTLRKVRSDADRHCK